MQSTSMARRLTEPDSPCAGGRQGPKGVPSPMARRLAEADASFCLDGHHVGFSMEEARQYNTEARDLARNTTPAEVLQNLQRGNARFWTGNATRPETSAFERRALIAQQFPSTAILACSDSRVPTEVVFDQGLGDMFVCRVAGNLLDNATTASLQYAVKHLEVKLLLVMGHEGCGAVKAAMLPVYAIEQEPPELSSVLKSLKKGLSGCGAHIQDARAADREAVVMNVRRQVKELCKDVCIRGRVVAGDLLVVGAFYEISSGIVDFFIEVNKENLEEASSASPKMPKAKASAAAPKQLPVVLGASNARDEQKKPWRAEGATEGSPKRRASTTMVPSFGSEEHELMG